MRDIAPACESPGAKPPILALQVSNPRPCPLFLLKCPNYHLTKQPPDIGWGKSRSIGNVRLRSMADGSLPARREGKQQMIWIEVDQLRSFAQQYGYKFNEQLAKQYAAVK